MARVLLAASLAAMALPASSFLMPGVSTVAAHLSSSNAASVRAAPMALRTGIRRPLALAMQDAAAAPVFAGDLKKAVASALSSENAGTIAAAFEGLKKEGAISKWNSQTGMKSRAVSQNEVPCLALRFMAPSELCSCRLPLLLARLVSRFRRSIGQPVSAHHKVPRLLKR